MWRVATVVLSHAKSNISVDYDKPYSTKVSKTGGVWLKKPLDFFFSCSATFGLGIRLSPIQNPKSRFACANPSYPVQSSIKLQFFQPSAACLLPENLVVWSFAALAGVRSTHQRLTPRQTRAVSGLRPF
jgi:hypothetical protein